MDTKKEHVAMDAAGCEWGGDIWDDDRGTHSTSQRHLGQQKHHPARVRDTPRILRRECPMKRCYNYKRLCYMKF